MAVGFLLLASAAAYVEMCPDFDCLYAVTLKGPASSLNEIVAKFMEEPCADVTFNASTCKPAECQLIRDDKGKDMDYMSYSDDHHSMKAASLPASDTSLDASFASAAAAPTTGPTPQAAVVAESSTASAATGALVAVGAVAVVVVAMAVRRVGAKAMKRSLL